MFADKMNAMKIMRIAIVMVVAALTSNAGSAGEHETRDGNWWRTLTETERAFCCTGMFEGVRTARTILAQENQDAVDQKYTASAQSLFAWITIRQCVDGMNQFYKDFRNRTIEIPVAFWIVAWQTKGATDEQVKAVIGAARANPHFYDPLGVVKVGKYLEAHPEELSSTPSPTPKPKSH
jgi:hypothetical protein